MITDPDKPSDWLLLARDRLEKADALFARYGPSWSGVELLHEAVERYLKGYLIQHGWQIAKTHDLGMLVAQACEFDAQFAAFGETAQTLTEQFWEQHYPGGDLDEVGRDYSQLRESLGQMVALIEATLGAAGP